MEMKRPKRVKPKRITTKNKPGGPHTPGAKAEREKAKNPPKLKR